MNPFKQQYIFIPNNISEKLKFKFLKAIEKYENKYGERLGISKFALLNLGI